MFNGKLTTTALALGLSLLSGCNSPTLVGSQAYKARVDASEREIEEHIAKGETVVVYRTTAPRMKVKWQLPDGEKSALVYGPATCVYGDQNFDPPVRGPYSLFGDYDVVDQRSEYHKHSIEIYMRGKKVAGKVVEGPGEWFGMSLYVP